MPRNIKLGFHISHVNSKLWALSIQPNFRFEFPATSSSEWNSIFRLTARFSDISKKEEGNLARYTQIFEKNFRKFSFHSSLLPEFLKFSVAWFSFRKCDSFRKLFQEISVPFAAVSKFTKVLGPVHTNAFSFENAYFFIRFRLPSTLIRSKTEVYVCENGGFRKRSLEWRFLKTEVRRLCVDG